MTDLPSTPSLSMDRRRFLRRSLAATAGAAVALGPLHALGLRSVPGVVPARATSREVGYGPLVNKGDLWLPQQFEYEIISVQGRPMSDGNPTPGIFDGMAAWPGPRGTTILIRNHENRERAGEIKVMVPDALQHDTTAMGGNTKLVLSPRNDGSRRASTRRSLAVVEDFAILGGTSTN